MTQRQLSALQAGKTVTFRLRCNNELTITPQITGGKVYGYYITSKDNLLFASTEPCEDVNAAYQFSSRFLRLYVSTEALPQLQSILNGLRGLRKKRFKEV